MQKRSKNSRLTVGILTTILFLVMGSVLYTIQFASYSIKNLNRIEEKLQNVAYNRYRQTGAYNAGISNYYGELRTQTEIAAFVLNLAEQTGVDISAVEKALEDEYRFRLFHTGERLLLDEWLGAEAAATLRKTFSLTANEAIYTYSEWTGGELVFLWDEYKETMEGDLFSQIESNEIAEIVNLESGEIQYSNREPLIHHYYSSLYQKMNEFQRYVSQGDENLSEICVGLQQGTDGKFYLAGEAWNQDWLFGIHKLINKVIGEVFHLVVPQWLLMLLVYLLTLKYALDMDKQEVKEQKFRKVQMLFTSPFIDTHFVSQVGSFLAFGVIVSLFMTLYIQVLISSSTSNTQADEALQRSAQYVESITQEAEAARKKLVDSQYAALEEITLLLSEVPALKEEENLFFLQRIIGCGNLMILDNGGNCSASANGGYGFQVRSPEDGWDYFNKGVEKLQFKSQDEGEDNLYLAVIRYDEPGYLCSQNPEMVTSYVDELTSIQKIMEYTCFDGCDKIFIKLAEPETVYLIQNDHPVCMEMRTQLSEAIISGNFTGQIRLYEKWYYVNELRTEDMLYICAMHGVFRWKWILIGIFAELVGYGLLMLILIRALAAHRQILPTQEAVRNAQDKAAEKRRMIRLNQLEDQDFRKRLNRLLIFTVFVTACYLAAEVRIFSSSVVSYLLGSQWERKFNLFSATMIVFGIVGVKLFNTFIKKTIFLISENIGSRAVTIGQMLCSLIQFGSVLAWGTFTLVELGMKLSVLLTGAGVTGLVIGYACQGVISDLLSGLFLVYEGKFEVGDWIEIDDWRGEVKEIGVRTTSVARGGDIRIFNNSCLSTITVLSRTMAGALCTVNVDYGTDLDALYRIIEGNEKNYRKVCPHIIDGPGIQGITELGDSGVVLQLWANVDDERFVLVTESAMMKETKRLFDENKITIPVS